jgi:hypothetical protein
LFSGLLTTLAFKPGIQTLAYKTYYQRFAALQQGNCAVHSQVISTQQGFHRKDFNDYDYG